MSAHRKPPQRTGKLAASRRFVVRKWTKKDENLIIDHVALDGLPEFLGAFSDCTSCSLVAVFRHPSVHGVFDFGLLYRFEIATKISKAQVYQKVVPPVGCVPAAFGGHVPGNRSDWGG